MAQHIDSVADSKLSRADEAGIYAAAHSGDFLFCSGRDAISKAIQDETKSPWSHVLQMWLPPDSDVWLTLESTMKRGVHVGPAAGYIGGYDGDVVLASRPCLSPMDIRKIRDRIFGVLDDGYDWRQEVSIAGHNLLRALPIVIPKNEYFCSGLQYYGSLAALPSLQRPGPSYPTPEDNWTDPSIVPLLALLK